MENRRVLVGRFFHESHAFNPHFSGLAHFKVDRDEALLAGARGSGTTLGGIVRQLDTLGYRPVPGLSMEGPPSGLIEHAFYVGLRDEFLERAGRGDFEAIALELHGAMGTTELPDADGDLLTRLRGVLGPDIPIAVGLDLHAHLTPAMLAATTICIACKENPHSDVVACGEKTIDLLDAVLTGKLRPVTAMAKVPMVLPGANETTAGPLAALHAKARSLQSASPAIRDISLYNVFRALDDHDMGQAAVVIADRDAALAAQTAETLARVFWTERESFVDELLSIDEALDIVQRDAGKRPFVLADMGDRVLAGAPGDSTAILSAALSRRALRGAIPITDEITVRQAIALGVGRRGTFDLGGRLTPGFAPLRVEAEVVAESDGRFRIAGPYKGGETTELGRSVVLRIDGGLSVLVTSIPGFTHDPEAFRRHGIEPKEQDFIVVKSGYHFRLNFKGVATPLMVRTPGIGYYTKGLMTYRRGRFWPEHEVGEPHIRSQVWRSDK